ncbi:MAG: hypothetical protein ACJASF_001053 [Vicingaceae bacterium]|jgi:hypothetical protein
MKNKFLLLATLFLILVEAKAQIITTKVTLTWGDEQTTSRRTVFDNIIGSDDEGTYIIKRTWKGKAPLIIEKYGNDMSLKKSVPLALGEKQEKRIYQYATQIDGELILFSTVLDNKSKVNLLYAQNINKATLSPSSKLTKIGAIEFDGKSKRNSGSFTYTISNDEKRILIYYTLPYEKDENEQFSYHIFDKDLNLLWEKNVTLPYENDLFTVVDYDIQENGDLYLLSKIFQEKAKERRKGKPNYHYQIIAYTNKGQSKKEYPIILEGKFLTDMKIAINQEGDIICGGFYSENGTMSINGSYFLKIDESTKSIVSKSFKEFGIDFITQNMTDKNKKKTQKREDKGKDVELYEYDLDDIVLKDDGGAILVGEQYYVRVVTTTDTQGNVRTTYHYYYNDIIVISIDANGQIEWTEKIAKRQHTINDGGFFSSYALAIVEDKMNFIFNDNAKNLATSKMTKGKAKGVVYDFTKRFKSSVAVLVQLDSDGRQVKEALFNAKEAELLIRPKVAEQISDKEMVIYGQKRKSERFGKITFK